MRALVCLVACGIGLSAPPLGAQDEEAARAESEDDRPIVEEGAEDREAPPSPDRFDPSEEISLDLPVSFPVDI